MSTLPIPNFLCALTPKADQEGYVVCARCDSDGGMSLLLYPGADADDLSDSPPLMLISDRTGDRLSSRVMDSRQDSRSVAQALVHELFDDVEDLESVALNTLVDSLSAWIVQNRSKRESGGGDRSGGDDFFLGT